MSFFMLKIIAMITMIIDHIGAYIFPDVSILRIIGRISFPIFAFCIANGYKHTKNKYIYIIRLLSCGILSIYPYSLLHKGWGNTLWSENIFFTLSLGLLCIFFFENARKKRDGLNNIINLTAALLVFICLSLSNKLQVEYGLFGVALVLLYHLVIDSRVGIFMVSIWGNLILEIEQCIIYRVPHFSLTNKLSDVLDLSFYVERFKYMNKNVGQWYGMLAAIPLCLYNGKKGYSAKWIQYAFYLFYPGHLMILVLIRYIIKI